MASLICTLFEGHYHLGAAALLNSLSRNGFEGDFVCGYRGVRPDWARQAATLSPKIQTHWIELETKIHLTNYKPTFIKDCLRLMNAEGRGSLFYMDPDMVIKAPWEVFALWAKDGIALVEDLNASLPAAHPYRLRWHQLYSGKGCAPLRQLNRYYNAGFIGLPLAQASFLDLWAQIITWSAESSGGLNKLKNAQPHDLFHSADQDAMNMALELSEVPIHSAGPEAMDFTHGGHLISHAAGGAKPWRGGFFRDALRGRPPGLPQKFFYDYVDGPIAILPPRVIFCRRLELAIASFIGRFYSRR